MTSLERLSKEIKLIYSARNALWEMTLKQFKSGYAGSILGVLWLIINPILITLSIVFVFSVVFNIRINNFPFFVLAGMFPWLFFANALSSSIFSIISQQNILKQFNLPRMILPISSVLSSFLSFIIGLFIVYPIFIFFAPAKVTLFPFLLFVLILNLLLVIGFGIFASVLNIFFRDLGQIIGTLLMFWMWVTPVFYSIESVPYPFNWICRINPVTPFIICYQKIIFEGKIPSLSLFLETSIISVLILYFGARFFMHFESRILKEI